MFSSLSIRPSFHRYSISFAFSIIDLLTVCLDLRNILQILFCRDDRQRMPEALVLNDSRVAETLISFEDPVGKHLASPTDLSSTIGEVLEIDVLAAPFLGHDNAIEDELLAIIGQRQLLTDAPLFAMAQDIAQPIMA
jgi:hypothetical protein